MSGRSRSAAAGAAAAIVWALQEPLDQKVLRCDYSDVALLGKAVTRGPTWRHTLFAVVLGRLSQPRRPEPGDGT
jgi:hypothetical protein